MAIYQEQEINDLTLKATPVSTDEIELQETGGGLSKKTTMQAIVGIVAGTADNMTALRGIAPTTGVSMYLEAHTTAGDGGHGHFRGVDGAPALTYADNNYSIIVPIGGDGSSAWLREDVGYITPQMAGAIGDGITDDTAALLAVSNVANRTVRVPAGTYLVSGLAITAANVHIIMDEGATIKLANASNTAILTVTGDYFTIEGGTLDGNFAGQTVWNGDYTNGDDTIYLNRITGGTIKNVAINNAMANGVLAWGCQDTLIEGNTIYNPYLTGIKASSTNNAPLTNSAGLHVLNNTIDKSMQPPAKDAIDGTVARMKCIEVYGNPTNSTTHTDAVVSGNTCKQPLDPTGPTAIRWLTSGIEAWGVSGNLRVTDNYCYGGYLGISCGYGEGITISGNVCEENIIGIETGRNGLTAVGDNVVRATGNRMEIGIETDGHQAGSLGTHTVTGNTVYGASLDGILIVNDTVSAVDLQNTVAVSGNSVKMSATALGNSFNGGIRTRSAWGVSVSGNAVDVNGAAIPAVNVYNSQNITVTGNTLGNTTTYGVRLIATTGFTTDGLLINGNHFWSIGSTVLSKPTVPTGTFGTNIRAFANSSTTSFHAGTVDCDFLFLDSVSPLIEARGTGTPEGVVAAAVGSRFLRTDGGAATTLYIKESGTGTGGWVGK